MDAFWAAPPVTRTLVAITLVVSVLAWTNLVSAGHIGYSEIHVWKLRQLWRLASSFVITYPKLDIIFTPYFMWTYGGHLESKSPRLNQPGDFLVYFLFLWGVITSANALYFQQFSCVHALTLAFAWTYSQELRGASTTFFVVTIPVQWLPFAMLLATLVMNGPDEAFFQASGLLAAHMFDFLTRLWPMFGGGTNYLQTPGFFKRAFGGVDAPPPTMRGRPSGTVRTIGSTGFGSSGAAASGSQPSTAAQQAADSWRNRGTGHRLG